jgi:hypothetical protein
MPIPHTALTPFIRKYRLHQAVLIAWDGSHTYVVTHGSGLSDKANAAAAGNRLKAAMGWPTDTQTESAAVLRLKAQLKKARAALRAAKTNRHW